MIPNIAMPATMKISRHGSFASGRGMIAEVIMARSCVGAGHGIYRGRAPSHPLVERAAPAGLELAEALFRLRAVEQIGEHVLGHGRGGAGTAHAVLDDHRSGVARLVERREEDEQAVVAI